MAAATFSHLKNLRLPPSLFNANLIDRIHNIWYADAPLLASVPTDKNAGDWFGVGRSQEEKVAFDSQLRDEFGEALQALNPTSYPLPQAATPSEERANAGIISMPFRHLQLLRTNDIDEKARNGMGIILLLDQISRNIFRTQEGQALVYGHYDRISRALMHSILSPGIVGTEERESLADLGGLGQSGPISQSPVRQLFFLLPLMHSEDLKDHDEVLKHMNRLKSEAEDRGDEAGAGYIIRGLDFEKKHRVILEQFGRYPYRNECIGRVMRPEEQKYLDEGGERFTSAA